LLSGLDKPKNRELRRPTSPERIDADGRSIAESLVRDLFRLLTLLPRAFSRSFTLVLQSRQHRWEGIFVHLLHYADQNPVWTRAVTAGMGNLTVYHLITHHVAVHKGLRRDGINASTNIRAMKATYLGQTIARLSPVIPLPPYDNYRIVNRFGVVLKVLNIGHFVALAPALTTSVS